MSSVVTFFHYTSTDRLEAIKASGVINETPVHSKYAHFGQGKTTLNQKKTVCSFMFHDARERERESVRVFGGEGLCVHVCTYVHVCVDA